MSAARSTGSNVRRVSSGRFSASAWARRCSQQLGAQVAPHHEGRVEVGYYPIRPTAAGHALSSDWPARVYHWHGEGFQLPHGATLLAKGDDFPVRMPISTVDAFGFQFHPDVTYAHDAWLDHAPVRPHGSAGHSRVTCTSKSRSGA